MLVQVIKSITTLLMLGVASAFIFSNEHFAFWKALVVSLVLQIVLYRVYVQVVAFFAERLINDRIREYSNQGIETACPCDRAIKHMIPIRLNADNSYKCFDCNRNVTVAVDVKSFLETSPLDLDKSDAALNVVYDKVTNNNDNAANI